MGIDSIHYTDWGSGRPIVCGHGRPLGADAWDDQMLFLGMRGFRVLAHDRRGHGRSGQTWTGNDMDTYADDLAALTTALDLRDAVHVGHSTGGGEVARYIGRHGTARVAKAVLIGAVPPLMLKTAANPVGLPLSVFDEIRANVVNDRSQFFKDPTTPFYGANRPGASVSQGVHDAFWLQGMMAGLKPAYDCIKAFSETDFTEDLKKIDVPTLVLHGDDDQIVPIGPSALVSAKLLPKATLAGYAGGDHGMCTTRKDRVNADLLEFYRAWDRSSAPPPRVVGETPMDVTDVLAGEHGIFHLLVEQLDDALDRCATLAELRVAAEPLALSLLGHQRVEEETLFAPYEKATGTLGPLRCLRHEHEQMDRWIRSLFRVPDADEMRRQAKALLDLVRRHLAREEEVMFTAARQALSTGALAQCGEEWARFRGITLGPAAVSPAS